MERLRDKRPVPGSVEETLVDLVKACCGFESPQFINQRVYSRVLDVVLGRRRKLIPKSPKKVTSVK